MLLLARRAEEYSLNRPRWLPGQTLVDHDRDGEASAGRVELHASAFLACGATTTTEYKLPEVKQERTWSSSAWARTVAVLAPGRGVRAATSSFRPEPGAAPSPSASASDVHVRAGFDIEAVVRE